MLDFYNDLVDLSKEDYMSKIRELSADLVPQLVAEGILKDNGSVTLKGLECMDDMLYTVRGNKLFATYNGKEIEDFIIGITKFGFNVASSDKSYAEIDIEGRDGDVLYCSGGFCGN